MSAQNAKVVRVLREEMDEQHDSHRPHFVSRPDSLHNPTSRRASGPVPFCSETPHTYSFFAMGNVQRILGGGGVSVLDLEHLDDGSDVPPEDVQITLPDPVRRTVAPLVTRNSVFCSRPWACLARKRPRGRGRRARTGAGRNDHFRRGQRHATSACTPELPAEPCRPHMHACFPVPQGEWRWRESGLRQRYLQAGHDATRLPAYLATPEVLEAWRLAAELQGARQGRDGHRWGSFGAPGSSSPPPLVTLPSDVRAPSVSPELALAIFQRFVEADAEYVSPFE